MKINTDYLITDKNKHGGKRKKPITVIVPHHNAGVTTGLNLAKYIKETSRQLSCTYVIGQEGEVFQTLDTSLEPYTTSNRDIDTRAVTFEIANSTGAPTYEITDASFDALVELSIATFKENGIKEAVYTGDKTGNIHLHKWYASTNCPGPYVEKIMPELARRINEGLGFKEDVPTTKPPKKSITDIAKEVNKGLWGNGSDRVKRLTDAGYDYKLVQAEVNRLLGITKPVTPKPTPPKPTKKTTQEIAREVLDGKWGNGVDRRNKLHNAGYNFTEVQAEVNKILGGNVSKPRKKTNYEIAREVIAGKWGNGKERKKRLTAAGYNAAIIQAEVNKLV